MLLNLFIIIQTFYLYDAQPIFGNQFSGRPIVPFVYYRIQGTPSEQFLRTEETPKERVKRILQQYPVIDGHNDVAFTLKKLYNNDVSKFEFDADLTGSF